MEVYGPSVYNFIDFLLPIFMCVCGSRHFSKQQYPYLPHIFLQKGQNLVCKLKLDHSQAF